MLIGGLAALLLVGIARGIVGIKRVASYNKDGWWLLTIMCSILFATLLIVVPVIYTTNSIGIQKLQAFRDYNVQNYATVVSETKALLSEKEFVNVLVEGSLEKTQVGAEVSKRLGEWRDAINKYNVTIASVRLVRNSWILPGFLVMPKIPESLTPLMIGK